jgi:hypothetical protein
MFPVKYGLTFIYYFEEKGDVNAGIWLYKLEKSQMRQ